MDKIISETANQEVLGPIVDFSNNIIAGGKARGDITPLEGASGAVLAALRIVDAMDGVGSVLALPPYGLAIILPDRALKDQELYESTMSDFQYVLSRYFATGAEK